MIFCKNPSNVVQMCVVCNLVVSIMLSDIRRLVARDYRTYIFTFHPSSISLGQQRW